MPVDDDSPSCPPDAICPPASAVSNAGCAGASAGGPVPPRRRAPPHNPFAAPQFYRATNAGPKTIHPLLARRLAFHPQARWLVQQHHARRGLVHVLAAVAPRSHKRFLDIRLIHAQRDHALGELIRLVRRNRKQTHGKQDIPQPPRRTMKYLSVDGFPSLNPCALKMGRPPAARPGIGIDRAHTLRIIVEL